MPTRLTVSTVVFGLTMAICGCGPSGQKPVHPVRGTVTFGKAPAHRALVVFHPVGETDPKAVKPRGEVGSDGSFTLSTYGNGDGAPEGDYLVTVEWWLQSGKPGDDSPATNRLHPDYAIPEKSGLKAHVSPGSNEIPAIELKR